MTEIFPSFQGEGVHTGLPTTFIRLAGCSLECSWCDTGYSRDPDSGRTMSMEEVMDEVRKLSLPLVCVTGGEPLEQKDCLGLLEALLREGYGVDLETNGSLDIGTVVERAGRTFLSVDVKTPSSGMCGSFLMGNLMFLGEHGQLKFVVKDMDDLDFTMDFLRDHLPMTNIVITPCGNKDGALIAGPLLDKVRSLPPHLWELKGRIRFMVQSHKVIWDEDRRGV